MKTAFGALATLAALCVSATAAPPIERVKLPPGFEITVFADGIRDARSMVLGEQGVLGEKGAPGDNGWLYIPVGAPCNVCDRGDPYASITRLKPDGSAMEIVARGVRNTVGFDWHPQTKELWFTDNGRDMLGDDAPPDELNHAPKPGMHFGFPYCHGGDIPDPDFAGDRRCAEFAPPARRLGAHVASLGMRFYTGTMFPAGYRNQIFIAEHGSWNRSRKTGHRVMRAKVEGGRVVEHAVFAEGFLDAGTDRAWGRPVDVQVMPDGALLVSDDHANAIYRIAWRGIPGS